MSIGRNASSDEGFKRFIGVHDMSFDQSVCDAHGFDQPGGRMNAGKTLFAQVMEFVQWKTLGRIVDRHKGDAGVRTFGCADLFRVMAFAQLTWRESLRDIEACLASNQAKLFHMGMKGPPARSAPSWRGRTGRSS